MRNVSGKTLTAAVWAVLVIALATVPAGAGWRASFSSTSTDIVDEQVCESGVTLRTITTMSEGDALFVFPPGGPAVGDTRTITETLYTDAALSVPLVDVEITETVTGFSGGLWDLVGEGTVALPVGYSNGDVVYAGNLNTTTFVDEPFPLVVGDPIFECDAGLPAQGCGHGYWKRHHSAWEGYDPADSFSNVFGAGPDQPLSAVIATGGGMFSSLDRHAVAAVLNAAHAGVDSPLAVDQVIALVANAHASGDWQSAKATLADANGLGCPF